MVFKWGIVLTVLLALGAAVYFYVKIDDQIRSHVEQMIADHYVGMTVTVGGANFVEGKGIEVRGILIRRDDLATAEQQLVYLDELFIACNPGMKELIQSNLNVKKLFVRRLKIQARRDEEGRWNITPLFPLPKFSSGSPQIVVESASVEISDATHPAQPLVLNEIDLVLSRDASVASGGDEQPLSIVGSMRSNHAERIDVQGAFDAESGRWELAGRAVGLQACPELWSKLPAPLARQASEIQPLRAQSTVEFQVRSPTEAGHPIQFSAVCRLSRGRFDDPRLPEPLTNLNAVIRASNAELAIENLTAEMGKTRLEASARRSGWGAEQPLRLVAKINGLQVNSELYTLLPEKERELWKKFQPAGVINVDLDLAGSAGRWQPRLDVQCVDVAFSYHKFPYRLERGSGTLRFQNNDLAIDLTAQAGKQPLRIQAQFHDPGPRSTGWVEIRGNDISMDDRLLAALPEKPQRTLRALHPAGAFQVYWRAWRDDPAREKMRSHLLLSVSGGTVRFEKFPYPLTDIRGTVEMRDDRWTFSDLEGTNDAGFVTCKGHFVPIADGWELMLYFAGTEVSLDEELRDALTPGVRRLWKDLKPQGRIDLSAQVRYLTGPRTLKLSTRIQPLRDTASIEPSAFPYRLEKLQGVVTYRDGEVELHGLRAEHGTARLAAQGRASVAKDGGWYLYFDRASADQVALDRDLLVALPAGLRQAVGKLDPTGPVNVRGSFGLAKQGASYAPLRSTWDATFHLHRSSLNCGVRLKNVHGEVRLTGAHDGQRFSSRGELAIDSLMYEDLQFTQVAGPLWFDNQQVLFGAPADRQQQPAPAQTQAQPPAPRSLTALLYDGQVAANGSVSLGPVANYQFGASLRAADLERFARESMPGSHRLQGKVFGRLQLQGSSLGLHTLSGGGELQLRDGNIYELPLTVALLKVLRIKAPDKTAFQRSDMRFRIAGEHIYFDQLDLLGDAVSLYGKGEMDFRKVMKLVFHSTVGRNDFPLPFWRQIVGEASQQIMQIHVQGTLANPEITNVALPAVNQVLQQLQADLQRPVPLPQAGDGRRTARAVEPRR